MKTLDRQAARRELLWSGHEDRTGLWEAVWWIQAECPEMQGDPARNAARSLLQELLREDLVGLCYLDEDTNTETPIPRKKALQILAQHLSFEPPDSPKRQLRFFTTEKGAKPLFNRTEAQQ